MTHQAWRRETAVGANFLTQADLAGTNFKDANMAQCNLEMADLSDTDLSNVDLTNAYMTGIPCDGLPKCRAASSAVHPALRACAAVACFPARPGA